MEIFPEQLPHTKVPSDSADIAADTNARFLISGTKVGRSDLKANSWSRRVLRSCRESNFLPRRNHFKYSLKCFLSASVPSEREKSTLCIWRTRRSGRFDNVLITLASILIWVSSKFKVAEAPRSIAGILCSSILCASERAKSEAQPRC